MVCFPDCQQFKTVHIVLQGVGVIVGGEMCGSGDKFDGVICEL